MEQAPARSAIATLKEENISSYSHNILKLSSSTSKTTGSFSGRKLLLFKSSILHLNVEQDKIILKSNI